MGSCKYIYETDLLLSEKYIQVICKMLLSLWNSKGVSRRVVREMLLKLLMPREMVSFPSSLLTPGEK